MLQKFLFIIGQLVEWWKVSYLSVINLWFVNKYTILDADQFGQFPNKSQSF